MTTPTLIPVKALTRKRSRKDSPPPRTYHPVRVSKKETYRQAYLHAELPPGVHRPKTREDCLQGENAARPCPWVTCKYHLYVSINERCGSYTMTFPHLEVHEMTHSCALDVADSGSQQLETIGEIINLTRERARQIINKSIEKLERTIQLDDEGDVLLLDEGKSPANLNKRAKLKPQPTPQTISTKTKNELLLQQLQKKADQIVATWNAYIPNANTKLRDVNEPRISQHVKLLLVLGTQPEKAWTFTDIVLAAWQHYPDEFSLHGRKEFPNSHAVACVMSKVRGFGWLSSNKSTSRLTEAGRQEAFSYKLAYKAIGTRSGDL